MKQNQQLNTQTATKSTTQTHERLDLEATQPQPWQIAHGKGDRQEELTRKAGNRRGNKLQ